jgi:hypothetical protein
MPDKYADVTGRLYSLLPEGPERDELLGFARMGVLWKRQHVGRRPGFLQNYVQGVVDRLGVKPTFPELLDELELEAARRNLHGERASPIEQVNRVWELITFHDPKKGRLQRTYKTFANKLAKCEINTK